MYFKHCNHKKSHWKVFVYKAFSNANKISRMTQIMNSRHGENSSHVNKFT